MKPALEDVIGVVRLQLGIASVAPGDHLYETLGASSADLVNIVATLEERFGLEIDDTDLADLETVAQLCRIAQRKWAERAP